MSRLSVEKLKSEFDRAFADPPQPALERGAEFLLVRVAGRHHALGTRQVSSVIRNPMIRRVPIRHPAGVGLLANRGQVYVALSLARLLGHSSMDSEQLALVVSGAGVALMVAELRHVEVPSGHAPDAVVVDGQPFQILDVGSLVAMLASESTK